MTMTPPASAAHGARRPSAPRTTRRGAGARVMARAAAALAAAAVLSLLTVGVSPSVAQAAAPQVPSALSFRVAAEDDGVIAADGELRVALSVVNQTSTAVPAAPAAVAVGRAPLASRSAVAAWLEGSSSPSLRRVGSEQLATVPSLSSVTATTTVDVGDDLAPGVYALRATYASSQGTLVARGVWVVPDEDAGQIAVVVPITAGPLTSGLLSAEELATLTAEDGSLRTQLDAVTGTDAVLAVDPAIVAAIRVLGTTAPASATEWLDDLLALRNSRFALQFGDADLATQFAAELAAPLTIPTLAPSLVAAGAVPPTPDATATPGAEEPATPDVETLTDIGESRSDVFWPADGTAGSDLLAWLDAQGDDPLTIVASDAVDGEEGPRARAGDAELLVHDAAVSDALLTASTAPRRIDRSAALATASAFASFADGGAPLLVTVGRADDRTPLALRTAVRAAVGLDGREAIGLDALIATGPGSAVTADAVEPDDRRAGVLEGFLDDERELNRFASILEDPAVLTAPERAAVLQLIGTAWRDHPDAWDVAVGAHREATDATLDAVRIVPSPDVNLLGSSAPLTFSVRNDLPWPVTLVLVTEPNDPRLVVQATTEVAAGAEQTTRVDVPVQARVGSGESSIDLHLRSTSMVPIGETTTIVVTVRAEWETVGIVVMAVLVGGLFVLGVIRTVMRLRRGTAPASDGRSDG
ncbi:DUF6049 family protein [Microbacterium sp. PA5]|uniref:DUF6049 family protein n=1 Tax=Microbacterium sp. PA5 TaxID=3416654 RepID=UPI003CE6D741